MPLTVKFIGALRQISGKNQLAVTYHEGWILKDLIVHLSREMPMLEKTLSDQPLSDAQSNALVLVNGRELSVLDGLDTKLMDGDEIVFVPVVHGG
jgi:molybdopterin synthase sulfur carrier subunit